MGGMVRLGGMTVAVVCAVALLPAAPAGAKVTIGPPSIAADQTQAFVAGGTTTNVAVSQPDGSSAASPFNGVVVRWRVLLDEMPAFVESSSQLRVLRMLPLGTNTVEMAFLSLRTGPPLTPPTDVPTILTQDLRVPIQAGEFLGIGYDDQLNARIMGAQPAGDHITIGDSSLPPGAESLGQRVSTPGMPAFRAEIEPDEDGDGWGDESQDKCPEDANTHGKCGPEKLRKVKSAGKNSTKIQSKVKCPAGRETRCKGEVAVRSRRPLKLGNQKATVAFGEKSYSIKTGKTGKVTMRLTSAERKLLKSEKTIKVLARISPEHGKGSSKKGKLKS